MARKQPLEFRSTEVGYVMNCWKASESSSLVGIGSIGKSNLIQHLADPDVQAHYLQGANPAGFRAIVIDPNMLGTLPAGATDDGQMRAWAGYELMMHRLFLAFYPFDVLGADDARRFYDTYQALQDGANPLYAYMGLRYFELGLEFFFRRGIQIVFMFDEFEALLRQMPVKFFLALRGLRDQHKDLLSFLTFTRAPLPLLVQRHGLSAEAIEPFIELFTDNVLYVGPYNEADGQQMFAHLARRHQADFSQTMQDFLMTTTGRYAGLLRAAIHAFIPLAGQNVTPEQHDELLKQLVAQPGIRSECKTIWSSLSDGEQYVLKAVARLAPYSITAETEQAVNQLVQKRLLLFDRAKQGLEIQPPAFRAYLLAAGESL